MAKCKHSNHREDAHTSRGCAECDCPLHVKTDRDAQEAAILKRVGDDFGKRRFQMGRFTTLRPDDALETGAIGPWDIIRLLNNHQRGWFGSISGEQWAANEAALREGGTVVSCYPYGGEMCIWIITDTTRGVTKMLLVPIAEGKLGDGVVNRAFRLGVCYRIALNRRTIIDSAEHLGQRCSKCP